MGRLTREHGLYQFGYTRGSLDSPRFTYLGRMHDLRKRYAPNPYSTLPVLTSRAERKGDCTRRSDDAAPKIAAQACTSASMQHSSLSAEPR